MVKFTQIANVSFENGNTLTVDVDLTDKSLAFINLEVVATDGTTPQTFTGTPTICVQEGSTNSFSGFTFLIGGGVGAALTLSMSYNSTNKQLILTYLPIAGGVLVSSTVKQIIAI